MPRVCLRDDGGKSEAGCETALADFGRGGVHGAPHRRGLVGAGGGGGGRCVHLRGLDVGLKRVGWGKTLRGWGVMCVGDGGGGGGGGWGVGEG